MVLMPVFISIDKTTWEIQHCPDCYNSFRLPIFEYPHCGKKHNRLYPGVTGLLWSKCSCGRFIPCASISKRKKLTPYCPKCNKPLAASNIKSLTIQVIGGNSSGKTAFISSFQHLYLSTAKKNWSGIIKTSPEDEFNVLEDMFSRGYTTKSSGDEVRAYYIIHESDSDSDDGLVFYDVPDEVILSEQYEKNPLNFGYCDGIAVIIDPLCVGTVRKECESVNGSSSTIGYSSDSAEDIIVHFIAKYSEIAGRSAKK